MKISHCCPAGGRGVFRARCLAEGSSSRVEGCSRSCYVQRDREAAWKLCAAASRSELCGEDFFFSGIIR